METKEKEVEIKTEETVKEHDIDILPTPNPHALKFIVDIPIKSTGKATFADVSECQDIPLAKGLLEIKGVDQVYFFQNSITISKDVQTSGDLWDSLELAVIDCINKYLGDHNPDFAILNEEEERRKKLSPELLSIEEILDKTIRPGLQGDGGDLICVSYKDKVLVVQYEGACGTCPSSSTGTLEAIKYILREQFDPDIEVYELPPDNPTGPSY